MFFWYILFLFLKVISIFVKNNGNRFLVKKSLNLVLFKFENTNRSKNLKTYGNLFPAEIWWFPGRFHRLSPVFVTKPVFILIFI
jgi:hypothetical protein